VLAPNNNLLSISRDKDISIAVEPVAEAKNYENMHEAQILAMGSCSDLSLDIAAFSCLSKLADTTDSHFDVEGNYSKSL
jgi:hypothetical protein